MRRLTSGRAIIVTTRHRESPYPLVTVDEALASILKEVQPLGSSELPVRREMRQPSEHEHVVRVVLTGHRATQGSRPR